MKYYRRIPKPPLSAHVAWLWFYEDFYPDHQREHVLPDGTFELVINLEERPRMLFDRQDPGRVQVFKQGWLSGAHAEYLVIDALPGSTMAGAHFKPGGAAPFLRMPAGELSGRVLELESLWGYSVRQWRERLLAARDVQEKFEALEKLLLDKLQFSSATKQHEAAISWALDRFMQEPHAHKISRVSEQLGLSQKHFIEVFRRRVGLPPKRFCRIRRFQQVLGQIGSGKRVDWAEVVSNSGYFDQAHFINEFVAFCGMNPSTYFDKRLEGDPHFARAND